jgi:hypothetical protein
VRKRAGRSDQVFSRGWAVAAGESVTAVPWSTQRSSTTILWMLARATACSVHGLAGVPVVVEADVANGLPNFTASRGLDVRTIHRHAGAGQVETSRAINHSHGAITASATMPRAVTAASLLGV